jgi:hypothetical protein
MVSTTATAAAQPNALPPKVPPASCIVELGKPHAATLHSDEAAPCTSGTPSARRDPSHEPALPQIVQTHKQAHHTCLLMRR